MMEASRIKIKDSIFILKDAVARDLANAADAKAQQALNRAIPSKVSELTNDTGYVTASYDEATEVVVLSISNTSAE